MSRVLVPLDIAREDPPLGWRVHRLEGASMGTTWSVSVVAAPGAPMGACQHLIQRTLDEVVSQMSHWDPHSVLGRYNRAAPGSVHVLPGPFFDVLTYALSVARDSGGAFDPSAGEVVNAWGFGPAARFDEAGFQPPSDDEVQGFVRRGPHWPGLVVDAAEHCVRQAGGVQLDLSSVAKGFAVDQVARALSTAGLRHHLVEVGGELRGNGLKPDGQPWWVALEQAVDDPHAMAPSVQDDLVLALHGLSVATSGDYRRFFKVDGQRLSHTLDPRTARPVAHDLASVTVVHADCMAADALSTVLLVLGPQEGLAWAEERDIAARFVRRGGDDECLVEHMSTAMKRMLQ